MMENKYLHNNSVQKWIHIVFAVILLISFFLPWVQWNDSVVKGFDMPAGNFFKISVAEYGPENPFPQLDFTFYIFWLIPVSLILTIVFAIQNKKNGLPAFIAGAMLLALTTVYYLFSKILVDFGIGKSAFSMLQPAAFITVIAAIALIVSATATSFSVKKIGWLIIGPVFAFGAFKFGEKRVMAETYKSTDNVKADYTISATDLLNEFIKNDSLANVRYMEKILVVNGNVSQIERTSDSTTNIRFDDPSGSYIVFSFDKEQYNEVKDIKPGTPVSLKGSCSGSIFSEILETTAISFKRSTINKNKHKR